MPMPQQHPPQQQVRAPYTGPTKKIFVGGLNTNTTEEDVRSYFSSHGTVSTTVLVGFV